MQELFDDVRRVALPGIWAQGVKLARNGAVTRASQAEGEVTLRVRAPGLPVAPTVTLYTQEREWSCDCGGRVDPCMHIAAATIALRAGDVPEPSAEAASKEGAKIVYRFTKKNRQLALERAVVYASSGREEKVGSMLNAAIGQARAPTGFEPTHADRLVDSIVGSPAREIVPVDRVADVFHALSNDADVFFEGKPVAVSGELVLPFAVVEDAADAGFVLRFERDPLIDEVVSMGVVLRDGALRPFAVAEATGAFLEKLPLSRVFSKAEETELVTKVIPELEKTLTIHINTKKLATRSVQVTPRIELDLSHHGHTLSVLPQLVYGDPAMARIDGEDVVTLGDGKQVPARRRDEERALVQNLRAELNMIPGRRVDFDRADATRFAVKLREWQKKNGAKSDAAIFEGKTLVPRLDMGEDGAFDIVFEHADRDEANTAATRKTAGAAAVIRAWRDGLDLVPLDGGGWASLPAGWLEEHGHRVADLLAARDNDTKKLPTAALPDLGALCDVLAVKKPLDVEKLAPLLENFEGIPRAKLPKDLVANLRHYQEVGVDWLSFLRDAELGAVLADDMGLGKTLQTICALRGRALVVCPKSVVYNWAEEIARFRPGLRTAIYHGTERELDQNADVTLTTYAVLRLDVAHLAEEEWDAVVLDEAQAIKNESSQTARAAFQLRGKFRLALSGTPVENRLQEFWSIMNFANPGLLGGRSDFQERYNGPISSGEPHAAARLRAKIRPFVLRRMKREVLPELPPRSDAVLHVELDETERSIYDAVRAATKREITAKFAQGGRGSVLLALEALLRLRQAACHPELVPGQHAESSSKIVRLLEALEEATSDGHRALVFSQWTGLLDLVEPHLHAAGVGFTRLDGSTRDRGAVVSEFQSENGPPVMLVSLKAGGTGLNLTAADHVFLLDPWWNPAVEDQAADRAHRIGQDRPVMVYRMVAKDTVEERIFALQGKKRALADVALGEADHAGGITKEELLALLD